MSTAELNEFRREEVARAVGKPGLTACLQDDYKAVEAWFLDLGGESGKAMDAHLAHQDEPRRVAFAKLEAECKARGVSLGYAVAICRTKFKRELADPTAPQLWKLFFDIKTRRNIGGRKARPQKPQKSEDPF